MTGGDIDLTELSRIKCVQYHGSYLEYHGSYLEYSGGYFKVLWGMLRIVRDIMLHMGGSTAEKCSHVTKTENWRL